MKRLIPRRNALAVLVTLLGIACFLVKESQAQGPQYVVTDLGTLGGSNSAAYGVNNLGQVTGYADLANNTARHAYLSSNGAMTDLGTLGGSISYGYGINNSGQVTGYALLPNGNFQAFLASMGSIGNIGGFNNQPSEGHGINNLAQITGDSYLSADSYFTHSFFYASGNLLDMGALGGDTSAGYAINNSGQMTGVADLSGDSASHAFIYANATMSDLGTLGGADSTGYGINNAGLVTGFSSNPTDGAPHAFVYSGGIMSDLGTLGGSYSYGDGINNSGQITGHSTLAGDSVSHAFLYSGNKIYDLNTIVPPSSVIIDINESDIGNHINDWGQIAAEGTVQNTTYLHALLLTPRTMGTQFSGGLGELFGGSTYNSSAAAVSNGGAVMGGAAGGGLRAFYWTVQKEITDLQRDSASVAASVTAISPDGRYLIGNGANAGGAAMSAFRYDLVANQNAFLSQSGGDASSAAFAISADDSTSVGWSGSANVSEKAVRWSGTGAPLPLGVLPGGTRSLAEGVSGNGSTIVGYSQSTRAGSGFEAFLWTTAGGMVGLGDLTGASTNVSSSAYGISQDGSTVVGQANSSQGLQAFRWTQTGGMAGLGFISGAAGSSSALSVSSDGGVIVGTSGNQAFVWDAAHGMRNLQATLLSEYGVDFSGWTLSSAGAVSSDATEVVGQGTDFLGNSQAFAAQINSRTYRFMSGDSYSSFHTSHLGGRGSSVNFLGGTTSGMPGTFATVTVGTSSASSTQLVSDVANVSGTNTDTYAIELSYDVAVAMTTFGSDQSLSLGWFNGTSWVNALDGNNGGTPMFSGPTYNQTLALGGCGLDRTNHLVWAVVNHGGPFAVINHTPPQATFSTWQQAYFTASQLSNPAVSGAMADPNGNGLANLLEYAFNLNPLTATQGNRPSVFIDPSSPNNLALVYTKFLGATDLTFTVQQSTDLVHWTTATPVNYVLSDNGVIQVIQADVTIPNGSNSARQLFLQLSVSQN